MRLVVVVESLVFFVVVFNFFSAIKFNSKFGSIISFKRHEGP